MPGTCPHGTNLNRDCAECDPRECDHGSLARSCRVCELEADLKAAEDRIVDLGNRCLKAEAALATLLAAQVATGPSEEEVAEAIRRAVQAPLSTSFDQVCVIAARTACAMLRGKP